MYLWAKRASRKWSNENEEALRLVAGDALVIIDRPNRKQVQCEVVSNQRTQLEKIANQFGGRIEKLPRDWLKRFSRAQKTKPLRVGSRLRIASSKSGALRCAGYKKSADWKPPILVIPAGPAFGTGEHATTAMSLRLLEKLSRDWKSNWSMVDLGTGTGILAIGARMLGAKRVIAIDNDPAAISTAKQNARLNKVGGIEFRVGDVLREKFPAAPDIVTANLFSELLVDVIPKLRRVDWLILSGILRAQERDVRQALTRNGKDAREVRRRGKWVAMLAGRR